MSTMPYRPRAAHRAPRRPIRLTQRGRIVRDLSAGAAVLLGAVFAQQLSVAYFTVVIWVGHLTGTAA